MQTQQTDKEIQTETDRKQRRRQSSKIKRKLKIRERHKHKNMNRDICKRAHLSLYLTRVLYCTKHDIELPLNEPFICGFVKNNTHTLEQEILQREQKIQFISDIGRSGPKICLKTCRDRKGMATLLMRSAKERVLQI